ncbi:MAG: hypothetical protein QOG55_1840, partial [Acidobacteriaceae bacterium]|nr:hypothetical protein [Acidobacteriaceae bacterium]
MTSRRNPATVVDCLKVPIGSVPHNSTVSKVRFGPFEIDLHTRELRKRGLKLKLSGQAFKILAILVERPNELVTREELRERLWPADTFVDFEHGVNTSIKRLRQVVGDSAASPRYIETLPRRGYRFVSPVEYFAPTIAAVPQAAPTPNSRRSLLIASVLLFFALLAIGAGSLNRRRSSASGPEINRLAVLPFDGPTDREQEYFTDGMTDSLITELGQLSALRVTSQTSSMHYKGTHKPLAEIAHELNVDAFVEGSVERSGNQVRIRAQVIRASTDTQIWARTFDGDIRDI